MWNPFDDGNWVYQRGSYLEKVIPPTAEVTDDPQVCFSINISWQALLAGAALQLAQPSTWEVADNDALQTVLGRATDLIAIIGTAGLCVSLQVRLTTDCKLQYSLDGGATWTDVANWNTQFPICVASNTPRIQMQPGFTFPPIPEVTGDGTDYVYLPPFP